MKKWLKISLLLLLCLALAFAYACGKEETPDEGEDTAQTGEDAAETVCTVTFDTDGGTEIPPVTCDVGGKIEQPADPVKEGYIFDGWMLPNGAVFNFKSIVKESMTLKAAWIEIGEAVVPEIEEQPETAYASEDMGGTFKVSVKQTRGYVYTFKWYLTNKPQTSGGTLLEGQDSNSVAIPAGLKKGNRYYVYGEVTGTRSATGVHASALTGLTKIELRDRPISVLVVGSGVVIRTTSGEQHDSAAFLQRLARAAGKAVVVESVALGSNYNIWETGLVGANYKNITDKFDQRVFDYVVVQLGRDYCLNSQSVMNNEKLAANNIYDKAREYNPNVKMVCLVPYARQDDTSKYYKEVYNKLDPKATNRAEVSAAIDKYWNEIKDMFSFEYSVVDSNKAFEAALKQGFQPWVNEKNDFAGVDGSYLQACLMYAAIFGKSPVGIQCFDTETLSVTPQTGVKLQALAAQQALGIKTSKLPDVSEYTKFVDIYEDFIDVNLDYKNDPIYKYPTPTVTTKLPASADTAEKEQIRVAIFGGFPMGTFNTAQTIIDFIKAGQNVNVSSTVIDLAHTSGATTFNLFEFFDSKSRTDINNMTFSTLQSGPNLKKAADKGLDYVILQTGRDISYNSDEYYRSSIVSYCKAAKIVSENNPEVKIILVAPYPHTSTYADIKLLDVTNMAEHAAAINKEAEDVKDAILKGKYAKNVQIVYVSDAFMSYGDEAAIKADLYQKSNGVSGRANTANRASAQGSYLMAATVYASIFKASPIGLPVYGSTGIGYNGKIIDGAKLLELQKLAYKNAFGKEYKGADPEHTITFFTNGGPEIAPIKAKTGAKVKAPADPTFRDFEFAGWFYDPGLTGRFSFMQSTMPPCDITLYAGWAKPAGSGRSYGEWHNDIKSVLFVGSGPMSRTGQDTGSFFKAIAAKSGRDIKVNTLAQGANYNIWETGLVGEGAEKVEKLCKDNNVDTLVLMLGRDSVVKNESTFQAELKMIQTIYEVASKHNPDVQVLFFSNYGRQDTESSYYKNYFLPINITNREEHAAAIEKYIDKVAFYISFPFRVVDVNRAFELCISRGVISPYGSLKNDYQDVYGSFLSGACVFAEAFKENPVGLDAFTTDNGYAVLPSYGMKLQAIAAEAILGIKTENIREVDDMKWVDPDTGKTSPASPPTLADGTKVKMHFDDETVEGALNVYMFGGFTFGSYNMTTTLKNLMTTAEKKPMNLVSCALGHGEGSTTYNIYELFASSGRSDINDDTFATGSGAQKSYRKLHSTKFDYVFIQTGRDFSLAYQSNRRQNVYSAVKIARLAVEQNPKVKIILVGPYGHMAEFNDFANMDVPIKDNKAHVAAINEELAQAKEEVLKITKNVVTVSLGDLFYTYSSDPAKIRADLYREANDVNTRANTGNRANAKGAYLCAAACYAAATGKSPTGLGYFGYETSSVKGKLEKDDAIAMQKLASKFVLGNEGKVPDTFTVTIDAVNGTPIVIKNAKEGDLLEKPEDPVREGYIFKGWYVDYEYSKLVDFENDTVPFGGMTVVAKWKLIVDTSKPPEIEKTNITEGGIGRSPTILIIGAGIFIRTDSTAPHDCTGFLAELFDKAGYNPTIRTRLRPVNYNLFENGLVGENYSEIEPLVADGKVDAVVFQGTRDYALISDSTASSEAKAVNGITELALSYNPNTKFVYVVPHARQDLSTSYYRNFAQIDVTNREEHSYAINDRMNKTILPALKYKPAVVDMNSTFEYLLKTEGINPWYNTTWGDQAGRYGDYALACGIYAGITGKSPVGLLRFTADKKSVEPTKGVAIQRAVAHIVLKQTDVPEIEISDTYVDRKTANVLYIGSRMINDNSVPETVGSFLGQLRKGYEFKSLTGSDSLAEFADSTAVNVEFSYGGETYDYIVLEVGRDAVLYDEKAKDAELAAIEKLAALGKENNKDVKIVLVSPVARQNADGQLYKDQVRKNGVASVSDYAKRISAYTAKLAEKGYVLCDLSAAADAALDCGISPYANSVSDYLSEDGSYLAACMLYNAMFGAMPDEITYLAGANADNAKILKGVAESMFAD
ncbi:MAG: InlB B-repeat-containing protein [Clostridia bacterium]|nr:InlB B-repeat-containing protein [Clostridia bacterium]